MADNESNLNGLDQAQGGEDGPVETPAQPARSASRVRLPQVGRSNLVLAGLFVAGLGAIYLLSLRNGPAAASADTISAEGQVDAALTQFALPAAAGDIRNDKAMSVVDRFYYQARQRQIPLSGLGGNAFVYKPPPEIEPVQATTAPSAAPPEPEIKGLSQALAAAKQLTLQSVLMNGRSGAVAMISNNLLSEGQTIDGWTITRIEPREVTLKWNDRTFTLKMSQ